MKENRPQDLLRSYLQLEFNDQPIAETVANWLTLSFEKVHISFYDLHVGFKIESPEVGWVDAKLERLRESLRATEEQLKVLKFDIEMLRDDHDVMAHKVALKKLSRRAISFHENYTHKVHSAGVDLKQLFKKRPKKQLQTVDYYLEVENGTIKRVNSSVYPNQSIKHSVPHISFYKGSFSSRIKFYKSYNLNGKLGHGTRNIAFIENGLLTISSTKQSWIS